MGFCTWSYWIRIIFNRFIWPIDRTLTTPAKSEPMTMKRYSTLTRYPKLELRYQMQFRVILRKPVCFCNEVFLPFCKEYSQRILSPAIRDVIRSELNRESTVIELYLWLQMAFTLCMKFYNWKSLIFFYLTFIKKKKIFENIAIP